MWLDPRAIASALGLNKSGQYEPVMEIIK